MKRKYLEKRGYDVISISSFEEDFTLETWKKVKIMESKKYKPAKLYTQFTDKFVP